MDKIGHKMLYNIENNEGVIEQEKPWLVITVSPLGILVNLTTCSVPCCEVAQLIIKKSNWIQINSFILLFISISEIIYDN